MRCDSWEWFVPRPWYTKCEPRGGSWFDILAHQCQPFGQRGFHVSLEESPHPSGKTGSMTEVRSKPALKSNPPNVYKMSLCPKTSSHTQTRLNFRAVCLWEDSIWQAKRKWERSFRRGLKPLRDRYPCGTSAVAERWIIWGCLRISVDELGCSEHEYHLRGFS